MSLSEILTLTCTALFAGAATYITFVEHPARLSCGTALALKEFRPSYRRGTVMQASLAVLGFASGLASWLAGRGIQFLIAAVLLGSVVPFTLLVILPTNKRLLDESLDPASPESGALLGKWGRLHAVRTLLSAAALGVLLTAVSR
jgi:Domain of unknown function (DUF1772)